jgi:tyrosine-protein phosphatase YwqE
MKLSDEEIRSLAKVERMMDAGNVPFVKLDGQRIMMTPEAMEHFELRSGQTITDVIFLAVLEFNLASIRARRDGGA